VETTEPELTPAKPGFVVEEAVELLGMCTAANFLGPVKFAPFPLGLVPTKDAQNPLPNDDGKTYPYPRMPIWPRGWTPGVPSEDPENPWQNSILTSRLSGGAAVNGAIMAHNAERGAYAIAFVGTLNPGAAMEDLAGILVPAGPVARDYFKSVETYVSATPELPVEPAGGVVNNPAPEPPPQIPLVHLGYREAVESLAVGNTVPANLETILKNLPEEEIDLYVTGHSLGASVAQLFSAWVKAGAILSKKINIKCYSFATPKCGNTAMASNYNLALSNHGFSYNVNNSLDTAQQLPPTREAASDLINPAIASDVLSKADPIGIYAKSPLAPIVTMILHSMAGPQDTPKGSEPAAAAPSSPFPFPVPFPFSIPLNFLKALSTEAVKHVAAPPSMPSMAFVGMGTPYVLSAVAPVVYNGRYYPPEFFPGRESDDLVIIPDMTTRHWWQHWPYNYVKYLSNVSE
jgi:hypothetical protein